MSASARLVDVLAVGADIGGLAFAHSLGPVAGVLVLEAANEVGGRNRPAQGLTSKPAPLVDTGLCP